MASEIRVDKINSLSGVGTVTLSPTGVDISGITTAATLKATTGIVTTLTATTGIVTTLTTNTTRATTGIVTTLTATTGIVTTLTTNTLTANSTAKVGSGVTLSPDGDVFVTGVTTSSTVNVGAAVTITSDGIEASGIGITCGNLNGSALSNRRNLIINGDFFIHQRIGAASLYQFYFADRWLGDSTGTDEVPTWSQLSLSSSDTGPWGEGFRIAGRVTNGNQTSGLGAGDYMYMNQTIEAQNIANSGWNYTSSSSYLTLSFWVRSSVAREIGGYIRTYDGTAQKFTWTVGDVSANTWTKKVLRIPGNSNLQFDNDVNIGLQVQWRMSYGSNYTTSDANVGSWVTYSSGELGQDGSLGNDTWYTTNDATYDITGVQLEVGSLPTAFEHHTYAEELLLCQRYFGRYKAGRIAHGVVATSGEAYCTFHPYQPMRATPTIVVNALGKIVKEGTAWYDITALTVNSSGTDEYIVTLQVMSSGGNGMSARDMMTIGNGTDFVLQSEI